MVSRLFKFFYPNAGRWYAFWILVIFMLCSTPGQYIPSNNWLDLLSVDKLVHAGIFFVMTALGILYLQKTGKKNAAMLVLIVLVGIGYGSALEIMQATVFSNRSADIKDAIANSIGCLAAGAVLPKRINAALS